MRTEWIILGVGAAIGFYAVFVFNRLVRERNLVREGWSGIDVQLRRRTDLIPNLVETVKAYAAHERSAVRRGRRSGAPRRSPRPTSPGKAAAERELQGSLGGCSPWPKPIRI